MKKAKPIKDAIFFCTTPYQVMTASFIAVSHKYKADLYLIDQMRQVDDVALGLRKNNIFEKVEVIREKDYLRNHTKKCFVYFELTKIYFSLNKIVEKIIDPQIEYRKLYVSSKAFIGRIVSMYYVKYKYNTELIYYDDGLGSYYDRKILFPSLHDLMLRYFVLGRKTKKLEVKTLLLYEPELFKKININLANIISIQSVGKWDKNVEFIEIMNRVFGFDEKDKIIEPIIIFDGIFEEEERKKINSFYMMLADRFGKSNIIIKPHPRDKSDKIKGFNYYKRSELPFEIICTNSNMENKLLITVLSTAVVTPIMLLDCEPYVLTLNEIKDFLNVPFIMNYKDFKNLYNDRKRFCIADTMENAIAFVDKFIESRGNENV